MSSRLEATVLPWQLPQPLAREVAVASGASIVVAGGLTTGDVSLSDVERVNPSTGSLTSMGKLPRPVHDAAGAMIGNRLVVFGGGSSATTGTIQGVSTAGGAAVLGQLPQPRSDLSAVQVGTHTVIAGGYDGTALSPQILTASGGTHMRSLGRLPVPLRYTATVAAGGAVWAFGGTTGSSPSDVIQRIDPATGNATVAGHLPVALDGAVAVDLHGQILVAGGRLAAGRASRTIYRFDPVTHQVRRMGHLAVAVSNAAAVTIGDSAYILGGENSTQVRTVQRLSYVRTVEHTSPSTSPAQASAAKPPFVGTLLIADRGNNRLLAVSADKRITWRFPNPQAPAPPTGFYFPDDAFFIHGGTGIISNQEGNDTIVEIGYPSGKPLWAYGHPRVASPAHGYLHEPDDAYLLKDGKVVVADANNCRIVIITGHRQSGQIGTTGDCTHAPPHSLGYPNGDTPLADGNLLISEVHGSWISEYTLTGHLKWTVQLPAVTYPSDPQQIGADRYLVADYARPGGLFEFNRAGRILWRYQPRFGPRMLNHPSLAEILPGGLICTNDDYRDRVVIIDPKTKRIVWQYGHTDTKARRPGYLNTPDGFDLLTPSHTTPTHPFTG